MAAPSRSLKEATDPYFVKLTDTVLTAIDQKMQALDISENAERPYKLVDPVVKLVYDLSSMSAVELWRYLEDYTETSAETGDNDAVYVSVLNIAGRGILVSVDAGLTSFNGNYVILQITIDGTVAFTEAQVTPTGADAQPVSLSKTFLWGFATQCLVQLKLAAAGTARYGGVALVE